jgi:hypothetical protein
MSEPMPDLEAALIEDASDEDVPTRTRKPRSDKGKPRGARTGATGRRSKSATLTQLTDDLLVPYASLAMAFGMAAPTVSGVLMARGEKTVGAIVGIAAKNPRMLAALQKASVAGPAFEIAETLLMVGVAGAMDFGRIPPEHPMAQMLGISDIYAQTHADVPMQYATTPEEFVQARTTGPRDFSASGSFPAQFGANSMPVTPMPFVAQTGPMPE